MCQKVHPITFQAFFLNYCFVFLKASPFQTFCGLFTRRRRRKPWRGTWCATLGLPLLSGNSWEVEQAQFRHHQNTHDFTKPWCRKSSMIKSSVPHRLMAVLLPFRQEPVFLIQGEGAEILPAVRRRCQEVGLLQQVRNAGEVLKQLIGVQLEAKARALGFNKLTKVKTSQNCGDSTRGHCSLFFISSHSFMFLSWLSCLFFFFFFGRHVWETEHLLSRFCSNVTPNINSGITFLDFLARFRLLCGFQLKGRNSNCGRRYPTGWNKLILKLYLGLDQICPVFSDNLGWK